VRRRRFAALLLGLAAAGLAAWWPASSGPAAADAPLPFEHGSWQALRQAHAGQPLVVDLWGLTCGPCLVELPRWGALLRERPGLKLVLIAADPVPEEPARAASTLTTAGLAGAENWIFADRFDERLRYEIDPRWRGELPRTLLIDRAGAVTSLPGVADLAQVRAWLDAQAKTPAG
jgi:thiol-disulfide isomerase/thioredoxin